MTPPYDLTPKIFRLVTSISEKLGEVKAFYMDKPSPQLRKRNKVRTIHSSLKIEGNTLTEEQITALIENKRVIGPKEDIKEVLNAIKVYEDLSTYNPNSAKSFLKAHQTLMDGLIDQAGKYRTGSVGILQGSQVAHLAPPAGHVDFLMSELFGYLKNSEELILIKSGVFHYEVENNPKVGQYADIRGFKMYYEIYGKGEPLLLIHGQIKKKMAVEVSKNGP